MLPPALPLRLAAGVLFIFLAAFESRSLPAAAPETESGVRLFQAQRYPEASSALAAAAGADPSDARAVKYLGRVYFEEGDFERAAIDRKDWRAAFESMDRLRRAQPKDAPALFEIGRIASLSGSELARGEECLRLYITDHQPKDPEPSLALAHERLGAIWQRRGFFELARGEYSAALGLDPGLVDGHEVLSKLR